MSEFNLSLFEACEVLNCSKRSITRYVRRGKLHPQRIKSQFGTLEYRFDKADLDAFLATKAKEESQASDRTGQDRADGTGQDTETPIEGKNLTFINKNEVNTPLSDRTRQDTPQRTGQDGTSQNEGIIAILRETTDLLKGQLEIKDKQIGTLNEQVHKLIERDRETNILLKGLQDNLLLLEHRETITPHGKANSKRVRVLWLLLLITLAVYFTVNTITLWGK